MAGLHRGPGGVQRGHGLLSRRSAWGEDVLLPDSQGSQRWLNLGLTLVDSLDTLLLMGLKDEFLEAHAWVAANLTLDQVCLPHLAHPRFHATLRTESGPVVRRMPGMASSCLVPSFVPVLLLGFRIFLAHCAWSRPSAWGRAQDIYVNLFETTIRVLGGLEAAFHLTAGDRTLLLKAVSLGLRLRAGFQSPSGIPYSDVNLKVRCVHFSSTQLMKCDLGFCWRRDPRSSMWAKVLCNL